MANAEQEFGIALARINLEDMARDAQALKPAGKTAVSELRRLTLHSHVHDLDSFGAIPLESKVGRFAGSPRDGSAGGMAVPASRGEGACRTRSGRAGAMRIGGARKEFADSLRPFASSRRSPAGAAEQPALALHELVLTRASQHRPARDRLPRRGLRRRIVCGRHRDHAGAHARARSTARSAGRAMRLRRCASEVDRANALLLSEPQVVVDWPAGSDEPNIDGDPGAVGVSTSHQRARLRQLARCRQGKRHGTRRRGAARARRSLLDDAHDARRPSDRSARPRHRRARRAAAERRERHQARAGGTRQPSRKIVDRRSRRCARSSKRCRRRCGRATSPGG